MPIGRIGSDFIVNSTALESQFEPSITALADGRFVVAWYSLDGGDLSGTCVRARIFNADGRPAGDDFTLDNTTTGNQTMPSLTALPDGRFVAAWESGDGGDGSGSCIRARVFDADGSATNAGNDFVVNTTAADNQYTPSLSALADGRFVAAWASGGNADGSGFCVRARLYNADGSAAGKDFVVNSTTANDQFEPSIMALANGRFVATWTSGDTGDGSGSCIRARLFNANGSAVANDFIVDSTSSGNQGQPSMAALADGRFVVTWKSADAGDGSGSCIRARVFDGNGTAAGKDFIVDSTTTGSQESPAVTALADGRFVVTWTSEDNGDGSGTCIRARLYGVDGQAAGSDFLVNSTGEFGQAAPTVTALADGRFVVTWTSGDEGDGSFSCIRARVFDPTVFAGTADSEIWRGGNLADTITGGGGADTLFGLAGNDVISGDAGQDELNGGSGDDRLFGGADGDVLNGNLGADLMAGGLADDIYVVDNAADTVFEVAGQGFDRILTSVSYALKAGNSVEVLAVSNSQGTAAINLTGNAFANELSGNAGANLLNGGGGADVMEGGAGNDVYVVDNAGDIVSDGGNVVEARAPGALAGQGDIDRVVSSISFNLANTARVFGVVENLSLAGTAAINGTGNSFANTIVGNGAANILTGGLGNDTLSGGAGNDRLLGGAGLDRLTGGAGNDVFVFDTGPNAASNRDVITDFANAAGNNDTIWLDNTVFAKLGSAAAHALNPAFFRAGAAAADANDYVVYDKATGALFYDSNGSAAGGSVQIATLATKPALTAADFTVGDFVVL